MLLHADALSPDLVRETLNVLLKFEQDVRAVEPRIGEFPRPPSAEPPQGLAAPCRPPSRSSSALRA